MKFSLEEIIKATGAKVIKNEINGINISFTPSTDTRTIKSGEIYLPLRGENFNGEDFIEKALEAGAVGYFTVNREQGTGNGAKLVLQVKDTLTAYFELARFYKRKIAPITVAITGSSGKTTTKEMAYCVVKEKFKTHKSELNFNNEIGLCKTILSMPEDTEVLILEMGMRGLGEIELLSKYSEPDIAIITNVGTAHIGRLGSKENIAKAKFEVTKYLKKNGMLITHDDEFIKMQGCKDAKMQSLFFSLDNVKILERKIGYSKFIYKDNEYELNIEGDYNIQNALAAIETGLKLGMNGKEIASGLKKYLPIEKRWDIQGVGGYKIINDSYNANPESMKAAIETFLSLYNPPLLLVLGDMGELGENEVEYHREIGEFLLKSLKSTDEHTKVITVGELANEITKVLNNNDINSTNFDDNLQTSRYILDNVKIGTTIILKASRSMRFEEIIGEMKRKKEKGKGC